MKLLRIVNPVFRHCSALLLIFTVTGCSSTTILPLALPPEYSKLRALTSEEIQCKILSNEDLSSSLGHQYIAGILPLATVKTSSAEALLSPYLSLQLALRGVRCNEKSPRKLTVTVDSLSLSGYDLIFFRRPSAAVRLKLELFLNDSPHPSRLCFAEKESHSYQTFAFETELLRELNTALESALVGGLKCLGVGNTV